MLGRYRRLPRITADRSWLGNTPCGLFVFTGSVAGKSGSRAEDVGVGGRDGVAEVIRAHAVGGKAGIGERLQGDFGDRRIGIARREGVDDPLFPEIARLTIAVESGIFEVGVEFGEDLGDEDRVVGALPVPLSVIAMAVGLRPTCTAPSRIGFSGLLVIEDGYGALGMVRHIEQGAVRCQGAAPRLGAHPDLLHFPALTRSTTETVPLMPFVTYAARSVGWTATQRGSWPTAISASLLATSLPFASFT